jgi:hypothetical protein
MIRRHKTRHSNAVLSCRVVSCRGMSCVDLLLSLERAYLRYFQDEKILNGKEPLPLLEFGLASLKTNHPPLRTMALVDECMAAFHQGFSIVSSELGFGLGLGLRLGLGFELRFELG